LTDVAQRVPHCFRFDWQTTALACLLTRCNVGSNIAINNAIMAITTKSSIKVKPFDLRMMVLLRKEGSSKPTFYFKT
jgi:hypothetical protein